MPEESDESAQSPDGLAESASPAFSAPSTTADVIPAVPDVASLVLIVTGSTMLAELRDRPLAYRLRERVQIWLDARGGEETTTIGETAPRLRPVVCSDLWYLNTRELEDRPAIAVGEPGSNAATAVISSRLPTAFVIERSLRVHLDPEFIDLRAALWGANADATAAAIDFFVQRYMDDFLGAA